MYQGDLQISCTWQRRRKGCSRNYHRGSGPQALFLSGGEGVLLTTCPRGGGGGLTCPGGQGVFDP